MKKEDSGCNGYYLSNDGKRCEMSPNPTGKVSIKNCKSCTCPGNKYDKEN
jgi:hypothetical protein